MSHEPDLNRLAALVEARLPAGERQRLLTHLADCRACRDIVAVLTEELRPASPVTRWTRPAVWLPIAATLAIASGAAFLVSTIERSVPPQPPPSSTGIDRPSPPPAVTPPVVTPPAPPAPVKPEDVTTRRSGTRLVGPKTFRLVAGEWIDAAYDPAALLPVVDVTSADARRELLARIPALKPYAALGERVTVVHEGSVYRFGAPK
jgi:hypothetical protein